jgi:hypothetical protein
MSTGPRPTSSSSQQPLAGFRLGFSPSYILVGVYRLSTDPLLRVPVWNKCKHGFTRGILVGFVWVSVQAATTDPSPGPPIPLPGLLHVRNSKELHPILPVKVRSVHAHMTPIIHVTFNSESHARSARVTGLSHRAFFGYPVPFELTTCMSFIQPYTTLILTPNPFTPLVAALLAVGAQVNIIINFFLRKNIAIAKQRAWDQTVASRGKDSSFWRPYVEEWDHPPVVIKPGWDIWLSGPVARFVIRKCEWQ